VDATETLAGDVGASWADHRDYLRWVRDPANGFQSSALALKEGMEVPVRVA